MLRLRIFLLIVAAFFVSHAWAEKTDQVLLDNGNQITGEVKSLSRGVLEYSTDAMGTVQIHWDRVRNVTSKQYLEVVQTGGKRVYGTLAPNASPNVLSVVTSGNIVDLPVLDVVSVAPVDSDVISGLDGNLRFGLNGTKANDYRQSSISASLRYRSKNRQYTGNFDSILTDSENDGITRREDLNLGMRYFRPDRWFTSNNLRFQHNDELNIELRTSITAGIGRHLIQSNDHQWDLEGGLSLSKETLIDPNETNDNLEAYLTASFSQFRFEPLDVDVTHTLSVYPGISDSGRLRAEYQSSARWELWKDLYWDLSLYGSYDSGPEGAEVSTTDWTLVTGIGWSF